MFMDECSFQVGIEIRLGCQLCRHFTCACGEVVDQEGLHPLSYKNAGQYFRHAEKNLIFSQT